MCVSCKCYGLESFGFDGAQFGRLGDLVRKRFRISKIGAITKKVGIRTNDKINARGITAIASPNCKAMPQHIAKQSIVSNLALGVVIGASVSISYKSVIQSTDKNIRQLGNSIAKTNAKFKEADDVIKYKNTFQLLKGKQFTTTQVAQKSQRKDEKQQMSLQLSMLIFIIFAS